MVQRSMVLIALLGIIGITQIGSAQIGIAQNDDAAQPWLTLFNTDSARPVLFQPLPLDAAPDPLAFAARLDLLPDADALDSDQPVADPPSTDLPETIYIAIENTGWSEGALGLRGDVLLGQTDTSDPDTADSDTTNAYVALEVWSRMGNLVLRDDGQGLMFPLEYVADLSRDADDEPVPGYALDMLINQRRLFRLYRVVEEGGLQVWGKTHVWKGIYVDAPFVSFQIDPQPVLGDLLLDAHIIALPAPTPTPVLTPTPEASLTETPAF